MFRSVFLRKIIIMMVFSLSLSAVLISILFTLASSQTLEISKENELLERAEAIAYGMGDSAALQEDGSNLDTLLANRNFVGSYVEIYGKDGSLISKSTAGSDEDALIMTAADTYLSQNKLSSTGLTSDVTVLPKDNLSYKLMIVQVPIRDAGEITGYIALINPMKEVLSIQQELLRVLLIATFVVAGIMLIPIYFITKHLVRPLQKVNLAARSFAQGDFSLRADARANGEIGELANSFNDLADKLSNSISELTVERNRLRGIFDVISEGIVSVDLDLHPVYSNPVITTLFENAKRKNLFTQRLQLIPFDEIWTDFQKCISEGTTIERTIDARDSAYQSTIVPTFDNNHKVVGATGFFRDISESEKLEQTRRDYVANVSHELRTPLTALRGLVEPLADGMVHSDADRMRYYGIILHETMRLSRLIDDMLELSRLQARTIAFKTFPFDLNSLLNELEAKFTPIMEESSLAFRVEFKKGPCPTVMGNPDRVEQILVILMDNAKKYTAAGGSITITTDLNDKKDTVLVSVVDTGQGIHEYDIDHIFDRFYKADRARGKKGTGLGLSIARELLSYMGETITVQSEYGEGTTFTFTLKCVHGSMWF